MKENEFLRNTRYNDKSGANGLTTVHKIYRQMQMKLYASQTVLCKYGEMGEQFFIVLKGTVGILVPEVHSEAYDTYYALFMRIMQEFTYIHAYKDQHSRVVKQFIDIFGVPVLKKLAPKKPQDLVGFVEEVLRMEDEVYEKYNIRESGKVEAQQRFLTDFLRHLRSQGRKQEREEQKKAEQAKTIAGMRRSTKKVFTGGVATHFTGESGQSKSSLSY